MLCNKTSRVTPTSSSTRRFLLFQTNHSRSWPMQLQRTSPQLIKYKWNWLRNFEDHHGCFENLKKKILTKKRFCMDQEKQWGVVRMFLRFHEEVLPNKTLDLQSRNGWETWKWTFHFYVLVWRTENIRKRENYFFSSENKIIWTIFLIFTFLRKHFLENGWNF